MRGEARPDPVRGPGEAAGARVVVEHVIRAYRSGATAVTALDGISVEIPAGSMVALTGPSGSGKSTLLHLLGALDRPDSGKVLIDDLDLARARQSELIAHRQRVGFVFQRFNLLPALTVVDNVIVPVLPKRTDFDKRERATQLLADVGLEARGHALPSELSGGQQQRVAIARALINRPRLLLADEPTGNLDSATGQEILALIASLRAERGMTVVVATHDPAVASRADRVIHLRDGRITDDSPVVPSSTPEGLLSRINDLGN